MNQFVIGDSDACIGCNTCMAACSTVHFEQGLESHPRLTVVRTEKVTVPTTCRHCEDAPCARVCPVAAIHVLASEIWLDEQTCVGCKMCALACPFGAITPSGTSVSGVFGLHIESFPVQSASLDPLLSWSVGIKTVAVKCDLCNFDPAGPACIRVCPTQALRLFDENEEEQEISRKRIATSGMSDPGIGAGAHFGDSGN